MKVMCRLSCRSEKADRRLTAPLRGVLVEIATTGIIRWAELWLSRML